MNRLQIQLSTIEAWRSQASVDLEAIVGGFHQLQARVLSVYGEPDDFSIDFYSKSKNAEDENDDPQKSSQGDAEMKDSLNTDASNSDEDDEVLMNGSGASVEVLRQIKELQDGAKDISVITEEGELGDLLDSVATWCIRSFKYLHSPRDIFDKRYYGAYDRFLADGQSLHKKANMQQDAQETDLNGRMGLAWGKLVSDQLKRLHMLKATRDAFKKWCREANSLLTDGKKMTAEKLSDLAERSRNFPAGKHTPAVVDFDCLANSRSTHVSSFFPQQPILSARSAVFQERSTNGQKRRKSCWDLARRSQCKMRKICWKKEKSSKLTRKS